MASFADLIVREIGMVPWQEQEPCDVWLCCANVWDRKVKSINSVHYVLTKFCHDL
jgi:hypothetical protein